MIYFTSDTHFGHANIIKYCNRPFGSAGEMDAAIIENIYNTVGPEDILYHLGDVALYAKAAKRFLDSLCCKEFHVILGNHDRGEIKRVLAEHPKVTSINNQLVIPFVGIGMSQLELTHYPPVTRGEPDTIKLYGHIHSQTAKMFNGALDVGVDGHNFMPWSLIEILEEYKKNT